MGHESVMEHISFTFLVEGVSRTLLAQLTRHRIASFSVQSQRYVGYEKGFGYVVPPAVEALGQQAIDEYAAQMDQMLSWYRNWQQKLGANEDARFVLPNACETRLLMTMNVRELKHFLKLRMCRARPMGDPGIGGYCLCPVLWEGARAVRGRGPRVPARRVPRRERNPAGKWAPYGWNGKISSTAHEQSNL